MCVFNVRWIDVTQFLLSQQQPVFMLDREKPHSDKAWAGQTQIARMGDFWVPEGDVLGDKAQWALTKIGDKVRVPVTAYKMSRALGSIWAVGLQVGLAALTSLRNHTQDVPTSATLVLGHEVTDLAPLEDCFRCYVGMALRTK